jgi:hypothetical protein
VKRAKVRRLVEDVLAARDVIGDRPVTVDTLSIHWEARTVTLRGRVLTASAEHSAIAIPMLSTDHLLMTRDGEVLA